MARPRAPRFATTKQLLEAVRVEAQAELDRVCPVFPAFREEFEAERERGRAWRVEMARHEEKILAAHGKLAHAIETISALAADARSALSWAEPGGPMRIGGPIPDAVLWAAAASRSIDRFKEWTVRRVVHAPTVLGETIRSVYINRVYGVKPTDRLVAVHAIVHGYMPNVADPNGLAVGDVIGKAVQAAKIERKKLCKRAAKKFRSSLADGVASSPWLNHEEAFALRELRSLDPVFDRACVETETSVRDSWGKRRVKTKETLEERIEKALRELTLSWFK